MSKSLSEIMEFDHVVYVDENGKVRDTGFYAPEIYEDDILSDDKWTLLQGFTNQYGYRGPHLHSSETIGGGLERYILENPGYYVALIVECWHSPEWDCDPEDVATGNCAPLGWVVAYRENFDKD